MVNRKSLAVDFDETLCVEQCFTLDEVINATPRKEFIEKVNMLYDSNIITVYTARRDQLISESLAWLKRNNVKYHAISNIKVPFDRYIDDKALHIDDVDTLFTEV